MPSNTSVKKNYLLNIAYHGLTIILPIITTPYLSRVMRAKSIGIYSYSYSVASYFGLFILLGLVNYGNRTIASVKGDKGKLNTSFSEIYILQLLISAVVVCVYLIYITAFAENKAMAWIQLVYLLSCSLDINWLYFGLERFDLTISRNAVIRVISVICIFVFVKSPQDLYIYSMIIATSAFISQLYLWIILKKYVRFARISWKGIIKHLKPNLTLFIPVIATSLYTIMDKIMLGAMSSMEQVGYYENARAVSALPSIAITALGTVMLPRVTNMLSQGDGEKTISYLKKSLAFSMFVSNALAFGICTITTEFTPLFYGPGYDECIPILSILVVSGIFVAWANVIRTQYLIPHQQDKIYVISVLIGAIVNILINLILIPKLSGIGAAIGTICAEASVCIYQTYMARKFVEVKKYLFNTIFFTIIGLFMFLVLRNIYISQSNLINMIIKILIGILFYTVPSLIYLKKKTIYFMV